jgi:hypothetical protein
MTKILSIIAPSIYQYHTDPRPSTTLQALHLHQTLFKISRNGNVTVAQKSYGSEKRYLNPPSIITATPPANLHLTIPKLQSVNLTILNESGQDIISQNSLLHNNLAILKLYISPIPMEIIMMALNRINPRALD